jgi:predicted amidohydrolase
MTAHSLKAALLVNPVTRGYAQNFAHCQKQIETAAKAGANFVLLGEMAVTGLVNNDVPLHDLPYAETVTGSILQKFTLAAAKFRLWLAFGLFEREGTSFFDSAFLLNPEGEIRLHYRRIHPGWHGEKANPDFYRQGIELTKVETDFGTMSFLICGDLFDPSLQQRTHDLAPDWVLHPFARSFADNTRDVKRWQAEELPNYSHAINTIAAPVLATSYLCLDHFSPEAETYGGAMVFDRDGALIDSLPIDQVGMLRYDVNNKNR